MIDEFFGGFISFDVNRKTHGSGKNETKYYKVAIRQMKYVELISNKNITMVRDLPTHFHDTPCIYSPLHGFNTISDIINQINDSYYFINDYDLPS